jgi:hypothetical protein
LYPFDTQWRKSRMELLKLPNVRGWGHPVFMVRSKEGHQARA